MHEAGFTEQIVESIIAQLKNHPKGVAGIVKVRVGEMFHLNRESVLMHYELLTKGTQLDGMRLELEEEPVQVKCRQCQKIGKVEDHHLLMCTFCDSTDVEIVQGGQILAELVEAK